MNLDPRADPSLALDTVRRVEDICIAFEAQLTAGTRPRIEDLLADRTGLERSILIRELLAIELEYRMLAGDHPARAEYAQRFSAHRGIVDLTFAEAHASAVDDLNNDAATISSNGLPRQFGDYRLLEELGRGGMGIVCKARQLSLDRIVAVKMILAGQLASAVDVDRFYIEAKAVAQLDHTAIVPIFEVGQWQGQHYFSMGFVEGMSLAQRITAGPLPPRDAAALIRKVALAVEYAHGRGVVHRDLKPANILLDTDGQPHITDFGLAKHGNDREGLTAPGDIIGTPSFMPPEQAQGQTGSIGNLSDVYSLGAVLYMTLTGHQPFQAATTVDTLQMVLVQEPVRPRLLNDRIPIDLETICLRAMDKEPAQRYSSANALADDLRRFLGGHPILARPSGRAQRLWRLAKRNPRVSVLSALAASLLLAVLVTFVLSAWWIGGARRTANGQQQLAERRLQQFEAERTRAALSFAQARRAVDDLFLRASDGSLQNAVGMQPLRKEMLTVANKYYLDFVAQQNKDPGLQAELATSYFALALFDEQVGDHESAERNGQKAKQIREQLCKSHPHDARYRFDLLQSLLLQGRLFRCAERHNMALAALQRAAELVTVLIRDDPRSLKNRRAEINCAKSLGIAHNMLSQHAVALPWHERACNLQEDLVRASPEDPQGLVDLGEICLWAGFSHDAANQAKKALAAFRHGQTVLEHLASTQPTSIACQVELARCYDFLGEQEVHSTGRSGALAWFTKALEIRERLVRENPTVLEIQSGLAQSYRAIADAQDKSASFFEWHERARSITEKLAEKEVGGKAQRRHLAQEDFGIAGVLRHCGRIDEAVVGLQRALENWNKLMADGDVAPSVAEQYAYCVAALAQCELRLGHHDDYRQGCDRLVEHCRTQDCRDHDFLSTCVVTSNAVSSPVRLVETSEQIARSGGLGPDRTATFGTALYRAGNDEQAVKVLRQADSSYRIMLLANAEHQTVVHAGHARVELALALTLARCGKQAEANNWLANARNSIRDVAPLFDASEELALIEPWPDSINANSLVVLWDRIVGLRMLLRETEVALADHGPPASKITSGFPSR